MHPAGDAEPGASGTRSAKAHKDSSKDKGKGKVKGKRETGTQPANKPAELAGMNYTYRSGKPICSRSTCLVAALSARVDATATPAPAITLVDLTANRGAGWSRSHRDWLFSSCGKTAIAEASLELTFR